jgi:hypothetical protein
MAKNEEHPVQTDKNGPGLGGDIQGIERSGPPRGMSGGDTSMMSGGAQPQDDDAQGDQSDDQEEGPS